MTILDGVPVKTRLPVSAWASAALVTFFSLMSSLIGVDGTGQIYHASTAQLLGFIWSLWRVDYGSLHRK
jgi:hypothetical protein